MDKNQKINCTVNSCRYNDSEEKICTLSQITVELIDEFESCIPD